MAVYALLFDGSTTSQYVSVPAVTVGNTSWEVEWACDVQDSGESFGDFGRIASGGGSSDRILIFPAGDTLRFERGGINRNFSISPSIDITLSHNYKITSDGVDLKLYVDAVLEDTITATHSFIPLDMIGRDGTGVYHEGKIEFFKYTDLTTSANSRQYDFNEGTGTTLADALGTGSTDGTFISPPGSDAQWVLLSGGGGFTLDIDSGAYTLTGGTVDLAFDRIVSIDPGSFSLTGTGATLAFDRKLAVGSGAYSLTGTDQGLAFNRALQIDSGSYELTGTDVGLLFGAEFVLDIDSGSFALTGSDKTLAFDRALEIDSGSFNLTGEALTLVFDAVGAFTLPIDSGSFELTGTDQELRFNRALSIDSGSYLLDGTDKTLRYNRAMAIDSGSYDLSGTEVTFAFNRAIIPGNGEFNLFGADLTLSFSGELIGASDKHLINVTPQDRMVNVLTQDRLILVNY